MEAIEFALTGYGAAPHRATFDEVIQRVKELENLQDR